jgi:hypothetical protein
MVFTQSVRDRLLSLVESGAEAGMPDKLAVGDVVVLGSTKPRRVVFVNAARTEVILTMVRKKPVSKPGWGDTTLRYSSRRNEYYLESGSGKVVWRGPPSALKVIS